MKVLVTGSSGLIGRWVGQVLRENGHYVLGFDISPDEPAPYFGNHHQGDILDEARLAAVIKETAPDAVIHLAARVDLNEKRDLAGYACNVRGVSNLTAAVKSCPTVRRAIYTSSQLVCRVGYVPSGMSDYCPDTLYGTSKMIGEQTVKEADGGGTEWCLVRPTTVWGPYMSKHYQKVLELIARGRFFHCGKSPLLKSYAFARNIAWQYLKLIAAPAEQIYGRTFYLADYEPLSLRAYLDALAEDLSAPRIRTIPLGLAKFLAKTGDLLNACGFRRFPFNSFHLRNIITEYVFDLRPTEAVCGPLPVNWRDGVRETARWFKGLRCGRSGETSCRLC